MLLPSFLIIGAQKAGTTSLYFYLNQHPQIYMSFIKETHFFTYEGEKINYSQPIVITSLKEYTALFSGVPANIVAGEASPSYIYSPKARKGIKKYMPNAKLIALLRHPADRAYSNFLHCIKEGSEPLADFAQALQAEENRINNWGYHWHYQRKGFYFAQLQPYFETFDKSQIKVYLYEDLIAQPLNLLKDIFHFLGVDESFTPDFSRKYNVSGIPKNQLVRKIKQLSLFNPVVKELIPNRLQNYMKSKMYDKPPSLSPELRTQLTELYREDILKLQDLIECDLSRWLK